jgi:predicted nuclease of predicted toxin-antitoxin system
MRFLADESCDFAVVRALRAAGHDIVAVADISPQADDETVMDLAVRDERLLITEDKDFGQLVYANARASGGVVFLRFPAKARTAMAKAVVELVRRRGNHLLGRFVVVQPGRIRIGKEPRG